MTKNICCPFCKKNFPIELTLGIPKDFNIKSSMHPFSKETIEKFLGVKFKEE